MLTTELFKSNKQNKHIVFLHEQRKAPERLQKSSVHFVIPFSSRALLLKTSSTAVVRALTQWF